MLRQLTIPAIRFSVRSSVVSSSRAFTYSAVLMGEGDTGSVRSGGSVAGDAFSRREEAAENKYMREKEMEKLRQLKAKIEEQKKHLNELDKHVEETIAEGSKKGKSS